MTRNEAIKELRGFIGQLTEGCQEVIKVLVPELRESEDERMLREIKRYIKEQGNKPTGLPNGTVAVADMIAWLEKQKENPKSADSISSDCTSDAKCEDRWHKVGDSLPDNPREVLCKDEAGNYFIGRYYVGEGWEISNYDDEDKPHHLNPPVSKWIDFPSEKQKEPHYTKRNALFDTCVENCDPKTVEEVNKRVDDIMNMSELSAFEQALTNFIGYWEDDEERWPSKFVKKHGKHILDMAREELQKEQKPPITGNDFGWIDELKHDLEHPEELDQKVDDVLKQRKGIRALEWRDEDNIGWDEAFACVTRAEKAAKNEGELQNAVTAEKWLKEIKFKYYVHPVKQEWSEKDEEMLNNIIEHLKVAYCACSWLPETLIWLKSLKKRFSYQTK